MVLRFILPLCLLAPIAAPAGAVSTAELRRHIEILASDGFEGRAPATRGERKTTDYIVGQLKAIGAEPAGTGGSWYQPVPLTERKAHRHAAVFSASGRKLDLRDDSMILFGRSGSESIAGAPVVFAGYGTGAADLAGAVALILYDAPGESVPAFSERVKALAARGAAAVIGITGEDMPWGAVQHYYEGGQHDLSAEARAPVEGLIGYHEAKRLLAAAGAEGLVDDLPADFAAKPLGITADLAVTTHVRSFTSNNVVGRLRGSGNGGQAVLYLGHWDHLGQCRPLGAVDRICNGAVDNASGIAAMLEIARAFAKGPRPERDILFLATTAEEMGLLGASEFAARPPVPLGSIVAAFNLDTVAIAGKGQKVSVIGRGHASLDALIDETVRESGRRLAADSGAEQMAQRQDGWALAKAGVPAVVVGGSFSDMRLLGHFLQGPYHGPADSAGDGLILEGAAEDAELLVAIGRKAADPARYQRPNS
jgi:Zn-dependent M28 family amino/carboxypeptidase